MTGGDRVLVIGYGNPGRGDDGLGPALAARLESAGIPGVTVESDYQLSIEHAALAAEHDTVVFVDAATDAARAFYFRPVPEAPMGAFTSHAVTAGQVLHLARTCFGARPRGYTLGIRAHSLGRFREGLSLEAEAGLDAALRHLRRFIESCRAPTGSGAAGDISDGASSRRESAPGQSE